MIKKLMLTLCLGIVVMLFAEKRDVDNTTVPDHVFRVQNIGTNQYTGPRSTLPLVDTIDLSAVNPVGYCWGITYDWERDALWVTQWNNAYPWMYCIQKTSPCTKIDSVQLGSGIPTYRLGIGYGGGDIMYMAGYDGNVYEIDMTTGNGTFYRSTPWSSNEGLGFNVLDNAVYTGDWGVDLCAYAQPAQTGSWNTWALSSPSGMSGAHGIYSPDWLFTVNEDASQAHIFQHSLYFGIPNTTPDTVWDLPAGMTQASTADCAFDGQYIYVLDQSGPDMIWVFSAGGFPGLTFDFEDGWQNWTHTSSLSFPAAWNVEASDYIPTWQIPVSGDSSMWIDSDAAGSGTWVQDTALSPVLVPFSMGLLKYGVSYNFISSGEWLEVGIKYFDGTSWNVDPLVTYTSDVSPTWDSVDVFAYNDYAFVQIYFYYDDDNIWAGYASFDNVIIRAYIAEHDVGCFEVISPPEGNFVPAGDYDVIGNIKNFGEISETFDVSANIYEAGAEIFTANVILTDFAPGAESLVNFGVVTFEDDKIYYTEIYTELSIDENPGNDTSTIYSNTITFNLFWDFETGWQGWTHTNGLMFPEAWDVMPSNYQPAWTPPDAGDSCMWIDADTAPGIQDTALSGHLIPNATTEWLKWGVGYRHLGSQFMDVGIKYYEQGVGWTAVPLVTYNANFGPTWDSVDISAYNTYDRIQIYFYFDDANGWDWWAAFDNVMINGDTTGVAETSKTDEPLVFGFAPNMQTLTKHPTIVYTTTTPGKVSLKIYDNTGRLIKTLVNHQNEPAGVKTVSWDGEDNKLRNVANGIYFLKLDVAEKSTTHKLILIK